MSIQRYTFALHSIRNGYAVGSIIHKEDGEIVTYEDHLADKKVLEDKLMIAKEALIYYSEYQKTLTIMGMVNKIEVELGSVAKEALRKMGGRMKIMKMNTC